MSVDVDVHIMLQFIRWYRYYYHCYMIMIM